MTCILDDDEADIEAEIQRELDALEDDSLQIQDVEDDVNSTVKENEADEDGLPDSIQEYLRLLHSRTEGVKEEVKECEIILEKLPPDNSEKEDEALLAERIKEELGDEYQEHPLVLRDQVLSELEEAELREEREKLSAENKDGEENKYALDIIRPGVIEEIQALEEKAQQELRELEKKQAGKDQERAKWYQERRREEEARREREKEARVQRQEEFEAAQKKLLKEQEALKAKLEMEAKEEERKLQEMEEKFQVEIKTLEEERRKQAEAFVQTQQKETEYQQKKQEYAASKIQKFYKGFRVRKQYQPLLEAKKVDRMQKRQEELDRIERVERKLREEAERKKLEEEQRRKQENEKRKRQEEEEKRKQEEAEKQRKVMEEERLREEKERKREEEKRKKLREQEEKRKTQEEERKKREEEEKLREEEERNRKMEEERRKAEEEARRKQIEEEKLREEELKRRLEEEKSKAEEENRRRQEEEKRRKELEERRKEELKRIKEVETRRKEVQPGKDEVILKREFPKEQREETSGICDKQNEKEEENKALEVKQNEIESPGMALTKDLEARRLQWVNEHTPWSTTSTAEERSHPVAMKSKPRRVFSASKHLPALTEEQLLKSSPSNTPLFRVKCISLRDEPSCSMQSLSKCPELRSLTLQNCGLLAVEGLEKCKELQELHMENNKIEAINCRDLTKLEEVSLANNNLASVHGLEGCHNITSMNLSNNKITRMGDLSTCSKLQQLIVDNNQLINTKGLSSLKNVQHLSLARNHLARANEIEQCMVLQTLNLEANNLQEPPQLINCVLLRELRLDDNSISSLDSLSRAWLPLLQFLSVSQNSISHLDPLSNLIMLGYLDISNNLISDTDSLVPGLEACYRIKTLNIKGNPVHEDPESRTLTLEMLPGLMNLDGERVRGRAKVTTTNQAVFINMCENQLRSQDDLQSRQKREISCHTQSCDPEMVTKRLGFMSQHNRERFELAVKHLLEHESFTIDNCHSAVREESRQEGTGNVGQTAELHYNPKEERGSTKPTQDPLKQRHVAATKIQALWRGWFIRHLIDVNTTKWLAAVTIQSAWRGRVVRSRLKKEAKEPWDPQRNSAAIVIQALFRGRRVRRRLAEALRAAQFYDDDDDDEEEFDYDEEVDLTAFDFDETSLEQGWTPSDTPQLPTRGPVLRMPGQSSKTPKSNSHGDVSREPTVPKPRHAWRSADSPITDFNQAAVGKGTVDHDQMSVTSVAQSHLSHRAEELSSEWGFRSSETAELMMRRAKKMKYNPARRKKLLDPNKRLALFKKLEETNKLRDVKPPPTRRQPPARVDYFAARETMASHLASTSPASEQHNKEQMTYSWVYRQAVVHEDEEKNIMADQKEYAPDNRSMKTSPQKTSRSPVSLPHMDPIVLSGRTLPLISSPLFSQSVEEAQSDGTSARRNSLSSEGRVRFPAIKTHSVPNLLARSTTSGDQPIRTEKSNSAGARIDREPRNKR